MIENSYSENPVMFPPGRARLSTMPDPTGVSRVHDDGEPSESFA